MDKLPSTTNLQRTILNKLTKICPAQILAISRRQRVRGRAKTLINSTKAKNGAIQRGTPPGKREPKVNLGEYIALLKIKANQTGIPKSIGINASVEKGNT